MVTDKESRVRTAPNPVSHQERVKNELKAAGLTKYELWSMEGRYLPHIIHHDEHLGGVIYGASEGRLIMLVATDRRVVALSKKPLFVDEDELNYDMVGGVSFTHAGPGSTVILHTRMKEYPVRTFNSRAAENFVSYIETRCLEQVYRADDNSHIQAQLPRFLRNR